MAKASRFSFPMPTDETLRLIPRKLAERFKLLPIRRTASTLTVVTSNPKNVRMLGDLERQLGLKIDARQVSAEEMSEALRYAFAGPSAGLTGATTTVLDTLAGGGQPRSDDSSPQRSLSGSHAIPNSLDGLRSLDPADSLLERNSAEFDPPARNSLPGVDTGGPGAGLEDTLGSLDSMDFEDLSNRPRRPSAEASEGLSALVIERARAHDQADGNAGVTDQRTGAVASNPALEQIKEMLHTAMRMGAAEIFVDSLADRILLRARIGFRAATLHEFSLGQGGEILAQLRSMADVGPPGSGDDGTGRIHLLLDGGQEVDFFLRTFHGASGECLVLDAIRYPGARFQQLKPRGIGDGSPKKLRDALASQLGDKRLAGVVTRQLTRLPCMLAVVAPRYRNRESMLALLADALAGPALGQRVVYVGERPRHYLDDRGVVLLPTRHGERLRSYQDSTRMASDYLLIEECADHDELAVATAASVSQHVIVGIPGADPIDILVFLTEAPEPRRLAQRLGSILFLDAQSMRVVEMNQPLREAVGSMEDASTFVQMFDNQTQAAGPQPQRSMEMPAQDPFEPVR